MTTPPDDGIRIVGNVITSGGEGAIHVPGASPADGVHDYLSTACLHGEHGYCAAVSGRSGVKTPAVCKWCSAPCRCRCHKGDVVA